MFHYSIKDEATVLFFLVQKKKNGRIQYIVSVCLSVTRDDGG